jgi:hypothetical protein
MSKDYTKMTPLEFATEVKNIIDTNDKETANKKLDEIQGIFDYQEYHNNPAAFAKLCKDLIDKKSGDIQHMSVIEAQDLVRRFNHIPVTEDA